MANPTEKEGPPQEGQSPRSEAKPAATPTGQQAQPVAAGSQPSNKPGNEGATSGGSSTASSENSPEETGATDAGAPDAAKPELPGEQNFRAARVTGQPLTETLQQPQPPSTEDAIDDLLGLTKAAEPSGDKRDDPSLPWPERLNRAGRRLDNIESPGEIGADEVLIAVDGKKEDAKPKRILGKAGFFEARKNEDNVFFAVPSAFARDALGKK